MKTKTLFLLVASLSPFCCLADPAKNSTFTSPTDPETWIAFLPVIFFAIILLIVVFKLKKGGVALSDLLAEKALPAPAAVPGGGTTPNPPQSVSRFIVFLTGLTALIIGICLTTFFIYCYFENSSKPIDLSNLSSVIWGLGIGVIPYGANKVSNALK